jgi:hypothetical protein
VVKLGFSGSRDGLTQGQIAELKKYIRYYAPLEVHHGCCIGGDEDFHNLVRVLLPECWIVGHPPSDSSKVSTVKLTVDELREEKPFLDRDRDIVDEVYIMLFGPSGPEKRQPRSGTWYTYRYALKCGRDLHVLSWE